MQSNSLYLLFLTRLKTCLQIKITRQEIGQIVGCSRETAAGQILKMLEDQNLISAHGKTIVVYDTR